MNRTIETNPNRMLGATISADNATYGLAPARPAGPHETVTVVANTYDLSVRTAERNYHLGGTYTVIRYADAVENADHLIQRAARLVAVGDVVFLGGAWREVSRVRRQGFRFLWDFADGKNAIRSQGEFVTVARIALAEAVAR